ncbi:MAG: glycoside hydrolase family 172 protein [Gemmatimonadota bacterium]
MVKKTLVSWPFSVLTLALATACAPPGGHEGGTGASGSAVTTGSLYQDMVDLVGLAEFPDPFYRTVQFSSYDRRSNLPEGPGWFANSDGFGGEPIPGFEAVLREPGADSIGEYLMAEVGGPGALVRLWTASIDGEVRLYLDGSEEPLFDGPADDFFRRPLEAFPEAADLDPDLLRRSLYQRDGVYAPIPFARGLKLIWIGNLAHTHFYEVEVRKYDVGTRVETFRPDDLRTYRVAIDEVMAALANPDAKLASRSSLSPEPVALRLEPDSGWDVLHFQGPGALERLELKLEARDLSKALRQTVLLVFADGHPVPQVESPMGDFFGAAPGINPYQSLPFTVSPDGTMISRWVMPFRESLRLRVENRGDQPVSLTGSGLPMDYDWDDERSMHFRARWRVDHDMVPDPAAVQDLPFLLAQGRGVYVGTTSILLNPNPVPTPYGSWWGEGDEKVFVDGEARPALFGTGSEDYYNYSWSSPDIFTYPYCGQPRNDGPGNRGFVTNYRWHVLDPLPFQDEIRFYMEAYPHERTPGFSYARIGYHYGRPGMTDDHQPLMPGDLIEPRLPEGWMPASRMGARNSVMYQTEELAGGSGHPLEAGALYAGGRIPVWRPTGAGARWKLTVPVEEEGEYRIHFVARLDPSGPSLLLSWDGEAATLTTGGSTVDLHRPHRTLLRNFTLSPRQLSAGAHTLEFLYEGAAAGVARPEVGLDFVWVQKVG